MIALDHDLFAVVLPRLLPIDALHLRLKLELLVCHIDLLAVKLPSFNIQRLFVRLLRQTLQVGSLTELMRHVSPTLLFLLLLNLSGRFMLVEEQGSPLISVAGLIRGVDLPRRVVEALACSLT